MVKLFVLFISVAAISFEAHGTIQSKDPSQNEDFEIKPNENSLQGQTRWLKKPGGWSKTKPCGRSGKPPCPTEVTTLPDTTTTKPTTTEPTTTKPITNKPTTTELTTTEPTTTKPITNKPTTTKPNTTEPTTTKPITNKPTTNKPTTTEPATTEPTTTKPTTTTGNATITPSNDEEPTPTKRPRPTTSSRKPISTTRRPKPSTEHSRPSFVTTSSTDVTTATAEPSTPTRRPLLSTPSHDGRIVFPDDDEYSTTKSTPRPIPTTSSKPTPTTTSTIILGLTPKPKPTPDIDVDGNKDIESTTVTISTTTQSRSMRKCIRKCPVTPEYNPVCGSDDVTYSNSGRLFCAHVCGVNVTVRSRGPCRSTTKAPSPTNPIITTTSSGNTYPISTTQSSSTQECIRKCPLTPEYNPVCGTDGVTYSNLGRLFCAQFCGVNVSLRARGPCRSTTAAPSSTTPVSTTATSVIRECIRKCPVTSEYNPLCGSDGVTYSNLGHLNCAYNCGVNINVVNVGPCSGTTSTTSTPSTTTTTTSSTGSTQSPVIRQCIRNCPVTSEYNPMCGSDGVTYTNPGRLTCAHDCGVNVQLVSRGPCSTISTTAAPTTTTESATVRDCRRNCPVTPEYNPVCGTDSVTYYNASHMRCAKSCKVDVQLNREGRCPRKI